MKTIKGLGVSLVVVCMFATCGAARAVTITAPFSQSGTTVTTPTADTTYNGATFQDGSTSYTVQISPVSGTTATLNYSSGAGAVVIVGNGSTITVSTGISINQTVNNGLGALQIDGGGTVTNGGAVAGAYNGIQLNGAGTVTTTGAVTGTNANGILIESTGTVNNSSTITGAGGNGILIQGMGTVTSSGAGGIIGGNGDGILITGIGNVTNSSTISGTGTGSSGIFIGSTGTVVNTGANITGGFFGILMNGGGTVTNTGTITGTTQMGVDLGGPGSVTNSGSITGGGGHGIYIGGAGTVINSGSVSGTNNSYGILVTGAGTVTNNAGGTVFGSYGIGVLGGGTITNNGSVTSGNQTAVYLDGNGTVNNNGTINAAANGIQIDGGPGTVNNTGGITAQNQGIVINGNGTVVSSGSITSNGNSGIYITGTGNVNVSGTLTALNYGIYVGGAATVTNSSTLIAKANNGIQVGSGTVVNSGTLIAFNNGILVNGSGTITNSGAVTSTNNNGLQLGSGNITNSGGITAYNYGILDNGAGTITNSASVLARDNTGIQLGSGTVNNTGAITAYNLGIYIDGSGTINNSATVTASNNTAFEINGAGTITNSGTVFSGGDNGFVIFGLGIVTNSGAVTAVNDGIYISSADSSVTDSGAVTAHNNAIEMGGADSSVTLTSGAVITASNNDGIVFDGGNDTLVTTAGTSVYGKNDGVLISGSGTAVVGGSITSGKNVGLWYNGGAGNTTVLATGVIDAAWNGIENDSGPATLLNMGTIIGTGNFGAYFGGTGTVTLDGGYISGPGSAIYTNNAASTITVNGRATLSNGAGGPGLMYNNSGTGSLVLNLVGLTPSQLAAFNAAIGQTTDLIHAGGETYDWQNYLMSGHAVSLELAVDPGLNQVATKLDNLAAPLPLSYDAFYLAALTNPEAALNSLVGREFDDAVGSIAINNATDVSDIFDSRAFDLRSGAGGFDLSGLSVTSGSLIASLGQTENALTKMMGSSIFGGTSMSDSADSKSMISAVPTNPWGAWASGTVTFADDSTTPTAPGFHATTGSPTLGLDYRVCDHFALGVLANYSTTGANFGDGSRLGVETGLGALYGTWSDGPWYVNGLAGAGYSWYDNHRVTLGGGTAQSSPDGDEVLANLTGGYDFKFCGNWVISPEAGVLYTHVDENSFAETGAGAFDLNQADVGIDSLRTKVGFHLTDNFNWDGIKFTPQLRGAWYHECLDDTWGVTSSLPGAPALGSFVVQTNSPGRDFAIVGAGLAATPSELNNNVTFFVNYDAQVGQANYISHTVNGGLRVSF